MTARVEGVYDGTCGDGRLPLELARAPLRLGAEPAHARHAVAAPAQQLDQAPVPEHVERSRRDEHPAVPEPEREALAPALVAAKEYLLGHGRLPAPEPSERLHQVAVVIRDVGADQPFDLVPLRLDVGG